jgi:toxin ParE1/3/4
VLQVELSQEADRDIVNILTYGTEVFGWDSAEAYVAGFERSFALMARHPEIGVLHEDFRPPIRSLPHGSHRLLYDIEPERIIVRRVLHKSVDVGRWIG